MEKRCLVIFAAAFGWALFAPIPWVSLARSQTALTISGNTVGSTATASGTVSAVCPGNPRNSAWPDPSNGVAFTITLQAGGSYVFDFWGAGPNGADTYMYLCSPSGAVLTEDDDSHPPDPNSPFDPSYTNGGWYNSPALPYTGGSRVAYTVPPGGTGTYTIYGTTYGSIPVGASYGMPASFPFSLQVTIATVPAAPPVLPSGNILTYDGSADSDQPPNPHADFFGAGSTSMGRSHPVSLGAGTYIIKTYTGASVGHPAGPYLSDSYLYLLNPGGAIVAQTSGDAGGGSTVTYTVPAGASGTYTIWVTNYQRVPYAGTIFYHLTVDGPPPVGGSGIPNVQLTPPRLDLYARPKFAFTLNLERIVIPPVISAPVHESWIFSETPGRRRA